MFFLNLMICAAFFIVVCVIIISFAIVRDMLTEVSNRDMGKVIANSRTAREITTVFADINLLTRTFYGEDDYLESEGARLVAIIGNIGKNTAEPSLKTSLLALSENLDSFLSHCAVVNMILRDIESIDHEIHEELTLLERLSSDLLLKSTMEGDDSSFPEQLLALVIGYRETLLGIGKMYAELRQEDYFTPLEEKTATLVTAIDDFWLRLQTITASVPTISRHGEDILNNVGRYREAIFRYREAMKKLGSRMKELDHHKRSSLSAMDVIDTSISKSTQLASGNIERIILISGTAVFVLSIVVIVFLGFATAHLIRSNINNPMNAILDGVDLFGKGDFNTPIELGREDEWGVIAKALDNMADNLLKNYTALRESEERFRDLAELLPQPVFETDSEGNLTYSNRQGFDAFGYTKADLENGVNLIQLYIPEDRERAERNIRGTLNGKVLEDKEYTGMKSDGGRFPIMQYASPIIRQNKAVGVRGIIIDVTERKRLLDELESNIEELERTQTQLMESKKRLSQDLESNTEALRRTQAQLLQSEKMTAVGQLAAGVAHEMNNPLTGVTMNAELIKEKIDSFPGEMDPHFKKLPRQLELIMTAARRCKAISDNLLNFSRQDESEMEKADLNDVIDKTFGLIRTQLRHKHIHMVIEAPDHVMIRGNGNQLQQAFTNVILNAAEAMESGGELSMKVTPGNAVWEVAVSDTGHGIPKENIDRIFEPFFTTRPIGKGTGLGLSIVYGIVEKHGGKITVDSAPGRGTTFIFLFPALENA